MVPKPVKSTISLNHHTVTSPLSGMCFVLFFLVTYFTISGSLKTSSKKPFLTYSSTELSQLLNVTMICFEWFGFFQDFILKLNPQCNHVGRRTTWGDSRVVRVQPPGRSRLRDGGHIPPSSGTEFKTPLWKQKDPTKYASTSILCVSVSIPGKN